MDKLKWEAIRQKVYIRDNFQCRLLYILPKNKIEELKINASSLYYILDPAHCLRKSRYPSLKFKIENIITLNRYSHIQLDNLCHPINGKYIGEVKCLEIWKQILESRFDQFSKLLKVLNELDIINYPEAWK